MGHHRPSEAGIFDFFDNIRACSELGGQIAQKMAAIRKRIEGDHTVGKGNFVKLENLRHQRRRALIKILEGIGIIVAIAGATVVGIGSLKGSERSVQQDDVSSISGTISLRFNEEGLK